jgi:hypothetical protein
VWEGGLATFAHALGEACMEHNTSRAHADVVELEFPAQVRASGSRSKHLTDLG